MSNQRKTTALLILMACIREIFGSNLAKVVDKAAYGLSQFFSLCEGKSLGISLKQLLTIPFQILIQ
jgi:hypothetical protein